MAYGTNAPFGLRPFSSISGGSWTEKTNEYYIFASADGTATYPNALFTGDPVVYETVAATSTAYGPTIKIYPINTTTAVNEITPVVGVFMGCEYILPNGTLVKSPYWPGGNTTGPAILNGSKIKAFILDDPDVVYDIQVSTATNTLNDARFSAAAATPAYFAQNFSFGLAAGGGNIENPATGSTTTGQSAIYLNLVQTNTPNATNRVAETLPLKTIGFTPNPQNVIFAADGTTVNPFLNVRVTINNHVSRVGNLGATVA